MSGPLLAKLEPRLEDARLSCATGDERTIAAGLEQVMQSRIAEISPSEMMLASEGACY